MNEWKISKQAAALHADALVWDNHGSVAHQIGDIDLRELRRYRASGVDMAIISLGYGPYSWEHAALMIAHLRRWLSARPDEFVLAVAVDDIRRAKEQGKLAIAFNMEAIAGVHEDVSLMQMFYDLGLRWMSLAFNLNSKAGGGCHGDDQGLTKLGRQVLDHAAEIGIVADCSHTGYRTAREIIEYSRNPVIFSNSNPRAMKDHARNLPDDLMKACASAGGVMGLTGTSVFLGDPEARPETLVRHLDHAVQVMGPEHVGIGFNFNFETSFMDIDLTRPAAILPEGLDDYFPSGNEYESDVTLMPPERLPEVTEGLLKLGYGDDDIRGILGGNFLRVARHVWK